MVRGSGRVAGTPARRRRVVGAPRHRRRLPPLAPAVDKERRRGLGAGAGGRRPRTALQQLGLRAVAADDGVLPALLGGSAGWALQPRPGVHSCAAVESAPRPIGSWRPRLW